ncbi:MAG: MipA/OmpV family protein [Campylobacterota bacterium]|nr:MipA/OmpV family protein [Campylobacterota bacterium]
MRYLVALAACTVLSLARSEYADQTWGMGFVGRIASIPYHDPVVEDSSVSNFVPLFYYEDDYFYLHGLTYGVKLYDLEDWQFSAISRVRFLNIPKEYQNAVQGDTMDFGLRGRYFLHDNHYIDIEVMENRDKSTHTNLTYSANLKYGDAYLEPYAVLRIKDADFNTQYYGLNKEVVEGDADFTVGTELKYHIWSNFYLMAGAEARLLGHNVQKSAVTDEDYEYNFNAGIGILNDKNKKFIDVDGMKQYFRLAHGWATPSNLGEILAGETESDPYNNQMTSIFYGLPLSKTLFNLPLEVYLTPGFVFHHHSEVQDATQEFDLAFKFYYTPPFPYIDMRLGAAEGVSYMSDVVYIEKKEMEEKGYNSSRLMLYLDFSIDLNLGFLNDNLDSLWIGGAVHHRSSVFEQSSLFGRIKGGSNYNTVYLQWDF